LRAQQKAGLEVNEEHGGDDSGGEDADVDAQDGFDGIATFDGRAKTLSSKSKKSIGVASSTVEEEPPLMNPELPHLAAVLDKADVVIEILDARDPLAYRSKALETRVSLKEGQRLLLVLNKIGAYSFSHSDAGLHLRVIMIYRRLPPRADGRVGYAPACGTPDTALPRRIVLSPTREQIRADEGKGETKGAL
jgi:hypothetical protein